MASLFIKDSSVATRVGRMAQQLGTTKTEVVSRAMTSLEEKLDVERSARVDFAERVRAYRAANPLPRKIREIDKAFFDRLWGDED